MLDSPDLTPHQLKTANLIIDFIASDDEISEDCPFGCWLRGVRYTRAPFEHQITDTPDYWRIVVDDPRDCLLYALCLEEWSEELCRQLTAHGAWRYSLVQWRQIFSYVQTAFALISRK